MDGEGVDGEGDDGRARFTVFCGLPGSGKSTTARRLAAERGAVRLCTDDALVAAGTDLHDEVARGEVQAGLYARALELLADGVDVVWEDGNWRRESRDALRRDAARGGARTELHVLDVDPEVLWERLRGRRGSATYPVTREELVRYLGLFEAPGVAELALFDEVVVHQAVE